MTIPDELRGLTRKNTLSPSLAEFDDSHYKRPKITSSMAPRSPAGFDQDDSNHEDLYGNASSPVGLPEPTSALALQGSHLIKLLYRVKYKLGWHFGATFAQM